MPEKRSFYLLVTIMGFVALFSMGLTNVILYQVAFKEASQSLIQNAQSQARLIEAMARYNRKTNRVDWEIPVGERGPTSLLSERAAADTISQLRDAHSQYEGFGETGEFIIAGIENQEIVFLLSHRNDNSAELPEPIPLYSDLAEPMRRALLVESGVMIAKDYRGVEVLAAYEPVDVLNFGIVAKIDMAEIKMPFIRGTFFTAVISAGVILLGTIIFRRVTNPIIEKISQSELQYRSLVEDISEWVWEINAQGKIKFSSAIVKELLGYSSEYVLNQPLSQLIHFPEDFSLRDLSKQAITTPTSIDNIQTTANKADGTLIYLEISATSVHGPTGSFIGFRGVARDITGRIQAENLREEYQETLEKQVKARTHELKEINEELQSFTYIVSHDLRSPLVSIVGFNSELKEDVTDLQSVLKANSDIDEHTQSIVNSSIPEALQFIDKAAEKMEKLIDSILALSRLGRREIMLSTVSLNELVDSNLQALGYQLDGVKVLVSDLPQIETDETSFAQIFGNLLGNAVKYLRDDVQGVIEVSCTEKDDGWSFSVADNGRGIAEKDIPHVFDLFKRVGTQTVQGEGMGLTYVQTMVRRLGGHITCESELGKGTSFTFFIPKSHKTDLAHT